ncbi:universal stress protein [Desulfopila sp. IMCC35006]|uniref:universal stress protein n=1 Tax=Desulfopila sp. IMCC35006 TaxID=2569542 RepID=UPI0010AC9C35|nr:universal stress protein [Desulfopila sp. IMCC35006]TKB27386.1 universal stress protein [Desulfopila sp. IMCC35006]
MDRRIILAYDGSINADWVARYAIQSAGTFSGGQLTLLHVLDGTFTRRRIKEKIAAIVTEGEQRCVSCQHLIVEQAGDVYSTLLQTIPSGEQSYCLCGARIAPRGRGFLTGTVSEKLFRCQRFNVMAIRVVSPGLLGCPSTLLFPLAGHPRGFRTAMPFLQMTAASVKKLYLLRVMTANPIHFRYISATAAQRKIAEGYEYLNRVAGEIRKQTPGVPWRLDSSVILSDDWAKEILIQAGKINASMILLGATERNLTSRFFYGNKLEQILRDTSCDVGIYQSI